MELTLHTDGGARGNPGPGAIGIVLSKSKGKIIREIGKYVGKCTNNEAEYMGLLEGIKTAKKGGATKLNCYVDSELVVNQLNGLYKVKNDRMKKLWLQVKELEKDLEKISYTHIPRSKNKEADALVNEVLDAQKGKK